MSNNKFKQFFENRLNKLKNTKYKDIILKQLLLDFTPQYLQTKYNIDAAKTKDIIDKLMPYITNYKNPALICNNFSDLEHLLDSIPDKKKSEIIKQTLKLICSTVNNTTNQVGGNNNSEKSDIKCTSFKDNNNEIIICTNLDIEKDIKSIYTILNKFKFNIDDKKILCDMLEQLQQDINVLLNELKN